MPPNHTWCTRAGSHACCCCRAVAAGGCPELGRWNPEVSPSLSWQEGGIWSAEVALPPGEYSFKCMLRRADGSYVWEAGENRHLLVRRWRRGRGQQHSVQCGCIDA